MSQLHDIATACLRLAPAETAHRAAIAGLEAGLGPFCNAAAYPALATTVAGLTLPNPLGLAAGFDKDARAPDALLRAGFGFVEVGTITPKPQDGNPKPRLFRLPEDGGVINRMGFNNAGLDAALARLQARAARGGVVGVNVGANKDSADRIGDYVTGLTAVWPFASYVTANVSSPNTPGLRTLQTGEALDELLERLAAARDAAAAEHGARPLFLKVAPDLTEADVDTIAAAAVRWRLDGLIVSNTTIERPGSLRNARRGETGGLSGRPLFSKSTQVLAAFSARLKGRVALIGAGGVDCGAAAFAKIKAGAGAVQLYTALALQGPGLVGRILRNLDARVRAEGFARVSDAVGVDG